MAVESLSSALPAKFALIGALGIGAQWLAWRFQQPAIVLLALAGLAAGPGAAVLLGAPLLDPAQDFDTLLRPMVALAVAVILFEGGLALEFKGLRDASRAVRRMVVLGAPIGWLLGTLAARYAAGLPWDIAALVGGLFVVTGPTVIMPLLRQAKLAARPAAVLKWEGIVNDPVGALLAVLVYEIIRFAAEGRGWMAATTYLAGGALFGLLLGIVAGWTLARAFRRGWIPEYLKAPVVLAAVLACFVLANSVAHETGLLAVTVFGMTIANARLASIDEMRRFKETIVIVLVSGVFVILTATLTPQSIAALDWRVGLFVLAMLFLVRPATVWLSTIGAGLNWRERLLVGWIAPRGVVAVAVAGFFAVELAALGRPEAEVLTPLAFAMVFATVLAHGFTIGPLARRLGLSAGEADGILLVGANPWSLGLAKALKELGVAVMIADTNWRRLRTARLEGVPIYYGEVLAEAADHRLDHARFSWVLAASANDAYNALVSIEFAPEVGRNRVFQVAGADAAEGDERAIAFTARGRTLIGRDRAFDILTSDWWRGWRFRSTRLTAEYDLERFMAERGGEADLILERSVDGRIALLGPGVPVRGAEGATILWFGPPKSDTASEEAA